MRSIYEERVAQAREIEGRLLSGHDKIVPAPVFPSVCRMLWPHKTAAELAAIAGKDERTAKRWLSGEHEPPIDVVLAIVNRIFGK